MHFTMFCPLFVTGSIIVIPKKKKQKKKTNDEIRYLFWRTITGNNRGVNFGNRQLARTSPTPPRSQQIPVTNVPGYLVVKNSKVLVVLLVYEYQTTVNDPNIIRYVQQEQAGGGDGTLPMLNSPPLAKLARLNGRANELTMAGGSFLDSVSSWRRTRRGNNEEAWEVAAITIWSTGSLGYLQPHVHGKRLASVLRGMTTFAPSSCLNHERRWCWGGWVAECPGCPNWDRATKRHYYKSWKTASISKSTRRHFRHRPRPLHLIMGLRTRERRRGDRGESGKFFPERIASTATDES